MTHATIFNYFALNDLQDKVFAQSANMLTYRLPSYGTFSTNLITQYWYGIPRNVESKGLSMDVDHMKSHRVSKSNHTEDAINFCKNIGARMSAMEHIVPEQMFSVDNDRAEGISATKALAIAAAQGQKIWTIDKST